MPHALIVEDDANSAAMLAEVVTAEGYSTATAGSLRDARRQLSFRPPDVVLLDLTLPDGSGMDLFESIDRKDCEIVLITGNASLETSIQALRLDTGLGHMAAALDVPTISLYGPTLPGKVGAYGKAQVHLCASGPGAGSGDRNKPCFAGLEAVHVATALDALLLEEGQ